MLFCTYAYVRACVTSEKKAFMLVPIPGPRLYRLELLVQLAFLLACLVKRGFLYVFKTYATSVYGKEKNYRKYNY